MVRPSLVALSLPTTAVNDKERSIRRLTPHGYSHYYYYYHSYVQQQRRQQRQTLLSWSLSLSSSVIIIVVICRRRCYTSNSVIPLNSIHETQLIAFLVPPCEINKITFHAHRIKIHVIYILHTIYSLFPSKLPHRLLLVPFLLINSVLVCSSFPYLFCFWYRACSGLNWLSASISAHVNDLGPVAPSSVNCTVSWLTNRL